MVVAPTIIHLIVSPHPPTSRVHRAVATCNSISEIPISAWPTPINRSWPIGAKNINHHQLQSCLNHHQLSSNINYHHWLSQAFCILVTIPPIRWNTVPATTRHPRPSNLPPRSSKTGSVRVVEVLLEGMQQQVQLVTGGQPEPEMATNTTSWYAKCWVHGDLNIFKHWDTWDILATSKSRCLMFWNLVTKKIIDDQFNLTFHIDIDITWSLACNDWPPYFRGR